MALDSYARSSDSHVPSGLNARLFERMRSIHRAWLEQLRDIQGVEAEFGAKLLAARSPAEATSICHAWMAKRLETMASEHQTFTVAWLALMSETVNAPDLLGGAPESDTRVDRGAKARGGAASREVEAWT